MERTRVGAAGVRGRPRASPPGFPVVRASRDTQLSARGGTRHKIQALRPEYRCQCDANLVAFEGPSTVGFRRHLRRGIRDRRGSRMIQLPLLCLARRAASGRHLRRILTGRCRVGFAHLILGNRCADGGARAGVRWPARMGLVGCVGMPKIASLQQGLFCVERSSDRDILPALVALGTPRHGGMIAPMRFRLASPRRAQGEL